MFAPLINEIEVKLNWFESKFVFKKLYYYLLKTKAYNHEKIKSVLQ